MKFIVNMPPMPAPRPRLGKHGTYNKKEYTEYKKAFLMLSQLQDKKEYTGSLSLEIIFYMPIPKSWSKKKQALAVGKHHTSRPDTDNLLKTVLDALNGVYFKDDSQISVIHAKKVYSIDTKTIFKIEEI